MFDLCSVQISPRMQRLLERAVAISVERAGAPFLGTENVLRALTEDPDGIAGQVLDLYSVRLKVQQKLDEVMGGEGYRHGSST
jgi:ATP-dependent Clp protease ATP-binding subunit ClpA